MGQLITPSFEPIILKPDFSLIWPQVNLNLFYSRSFGLKGHLPSLLNDPANSQVQKLIQQVDNVLKKISKEKLIQPTGIYQFFNATSANNSITIYNKANNPLQKFTFPRKNKTCLADYINHEPTDSIAFLVCTCGLNLDKIVASWINNNQYVDAHILSSIALSSVEALADYIHNQIRTTWQIAPTQGLRFSFGYPACPDLADQGKLWQLLLPDKNINVTLTNTHMMNPEASISAMVFHHPDIKYF